ncbi:hypothetical protein [Streptomyces sp. RerS4]|uniref:hypothetical protein n=1 Tax=Streptomyces sp. RerS4 TaxID=2942449 RepID=UPI00201BF0EA|nr:hypothetical protein [Streptomyces sp. RerS4]UQX02977.1 hypothetical protein M4D82_22640 [Streptomyces sp. RerS4]
MFIRPVGTKVTATPRAPGHPLLRGMLRRAAGAGAGAAEWGEAAGEGAAEVLAEEEVEALVEAARYEDPGAEPEPWEEAPPEAGAEPGGAAGAEGVGAGGAKAAGSGQLVAELTQLADLAREGLLTPEEFTTAKALLLGRG